MELVDIAGQLSVLAHSSRAGGRLPLGEGGSSSEQMCSGKAGDCLPA